MVLMTSTPQDTALSNAPQGRLFGWDLHGDGRKINPGEEVCLSPND